MLAQNPRPRFRPSIPLRFALLFGAVAEATFWLAIAFPMRGWLRQAIACDQTASRAFRQGALKDTLSALHAP